MGCTLEGDGATAPGFAHSATLCMFDRGRAMNVRLPSRSQPIPFDDPLHRASTTPTRAAIRWSQAPVETPAQPQPQAIRQGHASLMPMRSLARAQASPHTNAGQARQATVRYDGTQSLSVRSSATGRHYRFA
ncbi:MAG TPA: hypothetical protein VFH49_03565, partial [Aquabacterium sp.]|nr:hypothetical protein [Aquabacterium sp.]